MKSKIMNQISAVVLIAAVIMGSLACGDQKNNEKMVQEYKEFVKKIEKKLIPLYRESNLAYWNASISGDQADYNKYEQSQKKIAEVLSNKEDFKQLKTFKESGVITDSILARELHLLYNTYMNYQVDTAKLNKKIALSTLIENKFSTFRAVVNGKEISDNAIEEILTNSTNNNELKEAWIAVKKSGPVVAEDIIKIVKLRNEIAKELGFANYHEMSLKLSDQDPAEVEKIFAELDSLTRDAFKSLKADMDAFLAKRYKVKKEELMPWHYQNRFFQEAPKIYNVDLDKYYADKDLVLLTKTYYNGIGLNIDDILANSDLFEKPKKNQHAYCTDIDNEGDVRVLCNVKPNAMWMNTMLHEYGHAVYDKYIDKDLPYTLREPAHTFTTEAIAMIFGRFASNPQWMKEMLKLDDKEVAKIADDCHKSLRLEQLVFSRWAQVMYNFEKNMYANPDQDLNKLWWDLVEKYQMIKKPEGRNEPDWATKIHIATSPCYYHNYLLGELLASQLYYYINTNIIKTDDMKNQSYVNNKAVGEYLLKNVFRPGSRYYWNEMIERATGEKLTAKYYAKQFVN